MAPPTPQSQPLWPLPQAEMKRTGDHLSAEDRSQQTGPPHVQDFSDWKLRNVYMWWRTDECSTHSPKLPQVLCRASKILANNNNGTGETLLQPWGPTSDGCLHRSNRPGHLRRRTRRRRRRRRLDIGSFLYPLARYSSPLSTCEFRMYEERLFR